MHLNILFGDKKLKYMESKKSYTVIQFTVQYFPVFSLIS